LGKLDEIAKENNGHLALKRLTWADLYFTAVSDYMSFMAKQDITEKHANLKKVTTNVLAIDSIKKWVAKRPKTDA
jgi:prostaglandin-H2 D-isomerase / glutathione transferase